jgi:hypothetical protein
MPTSTIRPGAHHRVVLVLAALVGFALTAGCAGIPTSGSPQHVRKVADQTTAAGPRGPEPGQQPEQIVREFIYASALTQYDTAGESYVAARQFLTPQAQKFWRADSGSTVVRVLSDDFAAQTDVDAPGQVTVTATQIGELAADRSFRPVGFAPYKVTMHLVQSDGQWRISDPPADVLITQSEFSTAFQPRTIYFLDSSGRVVVPDLRYLAKANTQDLSANRLMDLLLAGPSDQIAGAARTQLGKGAQLASNVHIDSSGVAHVSLEGITLATAAARQALAAQVVWTLDQQVEIAVDGQPLDEPDGSTGAATAPTIYSLSNGAVANFSPDVVPGSAQAVSDAYYIDDGAILKLSDSSPMWGSVGTGSVNVVSAALSAASGALAAVARNPEGGEQLLVGRPFENQPTVTVLKATTLTKPSFTRWGYAAWTVQNGASQPEIYQVTVSSGTPTWSRVSAPGLADLGTVTSLELSPDGVRVAVVAGGRLYLGVISPAPDDSATTTSASGDESDASQDRHGVQVTGLHVLRSDLTDVGPITWNDSTSLLVGAKTAASTHRTVYEVSVDGQNVVPVTTAQAFGDVFNDVDAIASSATPDLPMLISFGGHIWELQGGLTSGLWISPDGGLWMSGDEPFYPN